MSKQSTFADADPPVALPKESYWIGNYQGYEDNEFHWSAPKAKSGSPVTFGSLVHAAKTNADAHGLEFPAGLGRPGIREDLHKSGNIFVDHSAKSEQAAPPGGPEKPAGLYDGPEYADRPEPQW
ncbi:MAG: hypothetical protein HOA00_09035, partial [Rhodospirillaceae bacterium]|nr:hypothetical protein [Rhodospirillaceae bacterium]